MNQSNQEQPQKNPPPKTTKNSLTPEDLNEVENPREFVENPAVAPPPLEPPQDLRVDLFKD
ncbi:hypothetical protein PCC7424_0653 [Gloeothece citriformis PCC 7424]|uniref:Uncharacterized protein n=1 Tax=Gloeothece citriformis (strain PCC 7424) TaxID=65393 RepID=B7KET7_GLOC7|nr:hypothetical protein [Gloeothece citriformis]ACK69112.1 hypothetical protein PCC7424_0653 [Gloeothece citriformis PCC 7424]